MSFVKGIDIHKNITFTQSSEMFYLRSIKPHKKFIYEIPLVDVMEFMEQEKYKRSI
jgi:hypothetical protein